LGLQIAHSKYAMNTLSELYIFVLGTMVGSFLNVCIYRIPRKKSIIFPASACPNCGDPIKPWDNIPILSYILLAGKCRSCKRSISPQYPLVELLTGFLFWLTVHTFGLTLLAGAYLIFLSTLIVVAFIDLEHHIIPNSISLPGILTGFLLAWGTLPLSPLQSLIGILIGGGVIYLVSFISLAVLGKEGMGGGDIKLMAMIGAFLGWKSTLLTIFLGSLAGSVVGISLMILKEKKRDDPIPFGPFLVLGAIISLFLGNQIIEWYFSIGAPMALNPPPASLGGVPTIQPFVFCPQVFLPGLC